MRKGKNQPPQDDFWLLHLPCGTCKHTSTHTYTFIINKLCNLWKIPSLEAKPATACIEIMLYHFLLSAWQTQTFWTTQCKVRSYHAKRVIYYLQESLKHWDKHSDQERVWQVIRTERARTSTLIEVDFRTDTLTKDQLGWPIREWVNSSGQHSNHACWALNGRTSKYKSENPFFFKKKGLGQRKTV